ncbi:MAG: glycosyltransferase family 39 protein [Candidatus Hydrogenedentes bacterium]|nr:glycosyltransferase family 39 protein [Candidatus Hydrogenedentota bacterium]
MQRMPLIAVLAAAFVVFSANIGGYDLWPPDEPRFGQVAREMMESGNPIALTINGEPYKEKPPFLFWMIALVSLPYGDVTESTARIPSVAAAILAVYFTFQLASRLYGYRVGLCAGFVLMTCALFWWEARSVRTDMLLTACLTGSLYAFWMHHETKSSRWLIAFYVAVCAAVFAKGPPGVVFPLLLAVFFYWKRREERRALHLGWGLLAIAAVIAIWIVPAYMMAAPSPNAAPGQTLSLGENLYRQTIGRFLLGVSKARPPYYYLENLPVNLFPWTLFLPWTVWFAWKRRSENDAIRLLLCWILPAMIFFSISSGKRAVYLLPLFPALAVLVAYSIVELSDDAKRAWVRRSIGGVWAALLLAVGLLAFPLANVAWFNTARLDELRAWGPLSEFSEFITLDHVRALSVMTIAALAFGAHAVITALRREARRMHFGMAGHFAGLAVIVAMVVMPVVDDQKGASKFCASLKMLSDMGEDFTIYSVAFSREEYIFYAKHKHIPYLVDNWPLQAPADMDPAEFVAQQRALGNALRKATDTVPIADWTKVSDAEVEALRAKSESVFAFAKAKSPLVDEFKTAIGQSVQEFAANVRGAGSTFLIVQEGDWRWLLPFAPELRNLTWLNQASVGSDRVLLFMNDAAGAAMVRATATTAP